MPGSRNSNNELARFGRVGVLAGGQSSERSISLKSGKAVYKALKRAGLDVVFMDITDHPERDIKKSKINTAFIALHGRFGEDGTVQRMLERMNIRYTGSGPAASRLALDKVESRLIFEKQNIPVPGYGVYRRGSRKMPPFGFPVVVKPQFEGSSIGLSIVERKTRLIPALNEAHRYGGRALVEKLISGREITVGILDDQVLPPIEIIPKSACYDFFAKYRSKDTRYLVPAPLGRKSTKKAQDYALAAHRALGCTTFSRVDMMLGEDGSIYVLEVNSIPGLTTRSLLPKAAQAAGIDFQDLCMRILRGAFKRK